MTQPELLALLDETRWHNAAKAITGLLTHHPQECLLLIGVGRDQMEALYRPIHKDARHQQVCTVWEGPIQARSFERWSMGFVSPDDAALSERPGDEGVLPGGRLGQGVQRQEASVEAAR